MTGLRDEIALLVTGGPTKFSHGFHVVDSEELTAELEALITRHTAALAAERDRARDWGGAIRQISDLINGTYPADLDREAWVWRRVMKVSEEVGEVVEALLGWLGENPRKGQTHTVGDVRRELLDVATAALAACAHLDDSDPLDDLRAHSAGVLNRLQGALGVESDG